MQPCTLGHVCVELLYQAVSRLVGLAVGYLFSWDPTKKWGAGGQAEEGELSQVEDIGSLHRE